MDERRVARLVDAQALAQARLEDRAVASAQRHLDAVRSWSDPAAVAAIGARLGGFARAASAQSAALTDAYLTRVMAELLGRPARPAGAIDVTTPLRGGVDSYDKAYWRVATTARVALSEGATSAEALTRAKARADAMVRTDVAMARREQALRVVSSEGRLIGYRRVIRPYMSSAGSCGLCIAAADRMYRTDQLLPIHGRCKCIVMPATRALDPGGTLNDEDLATVYASAKSNRGADLKRVRYRVEDHGEYGPTLVDSRHHFRGPDELDAAA